MKGISLEKEKTWRDKKKKKKKKRRRKTTYSQFFTLGYSLHLWKVREKSDRPNFFFFKSLAASFHGKSDTKLWGERKEKQTTTKKTREKKKRKKKEEEKEEEEEEKVTA